jgi:hypothetical protein
MTFRGAAECAGPPIITSVAGGLVCWKRAPEGCTSRDRLRDAAEHDLCPPEPDRVVGVADRHRRGGARAPTPAGSLARHRLGHLRGRDREMGYAIQPFERLAVEPTFRLELWRLARDPHRLPVGAQVTGRRFQLGGLLD